MAYLHVKNKFHLLLKAGTKHLEHSFEKTVFANSIVRPFLLSQSKKAVTKNARKVDVLSKCNLID